MKPRMINLYKWKLVDRHTHQLVDDVFVVDRGDNKRRSTAELKDILLSLSSTKVHKNRLTIAGFEMFRGYALSFNLV